MVWGLVSLSTLTQGNVWNANPLQMGTQTTVSCAQAEDSGLLSTHSSLQIGSRHIAIKYVSFLLLLSTIKYLSISYQLNYCFIIMYSKLNCSEKAQTESRLLQEIISNNNIFALTNSDLPCYKHYLRVSYQLNYCFIAIHTPTELFRKSTESCLAQEIMPNNNILQYHVIYTHSTDYLHKELRFHEQTKGNTYQTWPHRFPCSVICCNAKLPLFLFKICFFWPNKQPPPPKKNKKPK